VLLYGFIATDPKAKDMKVVGEFLSYDPYGLVLRRDDAQFATLVERTFQRMASERRLAELYNKWFLRRLPTGETMNLPISPQLEEFFRVIGQPDLIADSACRRDPPAREASALRATPPTGGRVAGTSGMDVDSMGDTLESNLGLFRQTEPLIVYNIYLSLQLFSPITLALPAFARMSGET
jgi:hypothetical protein